MKSKVIIFTSVIILLIVGLILSNIINRTDNNPDNPQVEDSTYSNIDSKVIEEYYCNDNSKRWNKKEYEDWKSQIEEVVNDSEYRIVLKSKLKKCYFYKLLDTIKNYCLKENKAIPKLMYNEFNNLKNFYYGDSKVKEVDTLVHHYNKALEKINKAYILYNGKYNKFFDYKSNAKKLQESLKNDSLVRINSKLRQYIAVVVHNLSKFQEVYSNFNEKFPDVNCYDFKNYRQIYIVCKACKDSLSLDATFNYTNYIKSNLLK